MSVDARSSSSGVSRRSFLRYVGGAAVVLPLASLTACDAASSHEAQRIRIAYQQFGSGTLWEDWINRAAADYTRRFPEWTIELVPIVAAENDYFTKNELLMSSPRTSPDTAYADSFILLSDVAAGYLQPVDDYIDQWEHWSHIDDASRDAVRAEDGRIYGVPTHTDTRALWFNKKIFHQAGLAEDWQPQNWEEILDAARRIKAEVPEVAPFFIYSGKAQGEKASMQGFEMLFYGTGTRLYDDETQKWVLGSQAFIDSLHFLRTVFEEELTLSLSENLDPNISETIYTELLPENQMGILLDGSWVAQNWIEDGTRPWPEWTDEMGLARMPTQDGGGSGSVTLAGGWCLTIPKYAANPDAAFAFIEELCRTEILVDFTIANNYITVREDVAEHEKYIGYSPTSEFFTDLLSDAYYRPALPAYPEVSNAIQDAMEAVMTMSQTPEQAAAGYDAAVAGIVGEDSIQDVSA